MRALSGASVGVAVLALSVASGCSQFGQLQAMKAFKDLRSKQFVPMHYGTFKLSFEELDEPPRWLLEIAEKENLTSCVKILQEGMPVVF